MPPVKTTDKEVEVVTDQDGTDDKQTTAEGTSASGETTTSQDEKATESFDEGVERAAREAFEESTGTEASSAEEEEEQESDPKLGADEKKEEGDGKKEDTAAEETEEEGTKEEQDKGPVPYERFHEKVQQAEEASTKLKEYEPMVQNYQSITSYLSQHGVTPAEFENGLKILALLKTDPEKAKPLLAPIWDSVNALDGSKLPPDLQTEVDEGRMDLKFAKELGKLRSQNQLGQIRQQKSQEQLNEERVNSFKERANETLTGWIKTHEGTDPDFSPKKNGDKDGKYELWLLMMKDKMSDVRDVKDIVKACEESYKRVNDTISRFIPAKKATPPRLNSKRSSGKIRDGNGTMEEMIADIAGQHGISVDPSQLK